MIDADHVQRPPKAALLVAQHIVRDVVRERLQPGDHLRVERLMLQRYQVARSTLREALRLLELHGLIMLVPGQRQGPVLCDPDAAHLIDTLALLMSMNNASVAMVTDVRMAVEPTVSCLAAERMSDGLLDDLLASVDEMRVRLGHDREFTTVGQRFHGIIASSTGNSLFGYIVDSLIGISSTVAVKYDLSQRLLILRAHEKILAALMSRDGSTSKALMRDHLEECRRFAQVASP